jgi:esterase/lipase
VRRVTAGVLFILLGLGSSGPPVAYARTTKTKQTKQQKDAAKQYKKYSKQYNKQQKKQLKAQQKANKKFNKSRPTITVT